LGAGEGLTSRSVFTHPVPLAASHDLGAFACGKPQLDEWLKGKARKSEGRYARTYVVEDADGAVAGFYCLSVGSVEHRGSPGRLRRNAPDPIPISLLGRLAVDRRHAGKGLGSSLLQDAMLRVLEVSRHVGIRALLVHALDDDALRFYLSQAEFLTFPEGGRTLFLPLETLIEALPQG
jgi:GNAT superfamily N-acetyltransferase